MCCSTNLASVAGSAISDPLRLQFPWLARCDACHDVCPTSCITFTANGEEDDLRTRLLAPAENRSQDLMISDILPTARVMVKDEDVCLHCGLCAERCPTSAWDMQKYLYKVTKTTEII